ncbi:MAG: hypothetical protein KKB20_27890, partial [Proteobacteria bacterium]|nr:hypothetical protein [Pseudomonadota bacterium]
MPTCLEKNRAALEACRPDLLPYGQGAEKSEHQVVLARTGLPVLLKETRHGLLSLHSRIDPEKEAADLIGRLELEPGRILVILGLGLGYHLDALLPKLPPDYPVVVIESEAETFEAALRLKDLSAALERPGLEILVGTSPGQAIERIDRIRFKQGLPSPLVLVHPPSVRSRPDYYHPIREALEASASSPLAGRLLRPRLKTDRLGVLLLDTGYHLIRETEAAARSLGHRVHRLAVPGKGGARQETMSRLIHDIADFKPDFLLTVNHLGFDEGGVLADVLARLRLPFA